jgi:ABC-2 type transport system permease protein
VIDQLKKYQFLFEELVKRDFKKKYKRTVLGMGWSILSPLLVLLVRNPEIAELFSHGS